MDPVISLGLVTWDKTRMKTFLRVSASPEARALIYRYGDIVIRESKQKLPHQTGKRYTKFTPLKEAFITADPKLKKIKYQGEMIESFTLKVKPKKNRVYYGVVMSGHAFRKGWHYKFKFSNPEAIIYPIERTTRDNNAKMNLEFFFLLHRKVEKISDSDNKMTGGNL